MLADLFAPQVYAPAVGLRAVAMLWVVWFHAVTTGAIESLGATVLGCNVACRAGVIPFPPAGRFDASVGDRLLNAWWPVAIPMNGDVGVDLFLVLSGFLLGHMLCAELARAERIALLRFYCRRYFRIAPALALALVASSLLLPNDRAGCISQQRWWTNMLFVNNYASSWFSACMVHTWSVAVEVQMYIVTPPLLLLGHAIHRRAGVALTPAYLSVLAAGWLGCCVLRFATADLETAQSHYFDTPHRIAPYLAGMGAAVAVRQQKDAPYATPGPTGLALATVASWVVVLLVATLGAEPMYLLQRTELGVTYEREHRRLLWAHVALGRPLLGLAAAFLLGTSVTGHAPRLCALLSAPAWRPIAVLSYSAYLLQYLGAACWAPTYAFFGGPRLDVAAAPAWLGWLLLHLKFALMLAATLPLAVGSYALVERPLLLYGRSVASGLPLL